MDKNAPILIAGLGNPGKEYEKTRHNIGAFVLSCFAEENGISLKKSSKLEGFVGTGSVEGRKAILLFPTTFMNLSGRAVRKTMEYYKVPLKNLLVLTDDIYVPFGGLRYRQKGGAGGHNGLKDIQKTFGSMEYSRLRIGVGENREEDLNDHVLGVFTREEQDKMDEISDLCIEEIKRKFLSQEKSPSEDKQKEDLRSN